ncbi:helix-turn-helix domain-containing protein [Actinosynnema sp. NPDC059797]
MSPVRWKPSRNLVGTCPPVALISEFWSVHSTRPPPEDSVSRPDPDPYRLLHTPAEAAALLAVRESWLRRKAGRREIPCTFLGKHLRFSPDDLASIARSGARPARSLRSPARRGRPFPG